MPRWSGLLISAVFLVGLGAHCGATRPAASRSGGVVAATSAGPGAHLRSNILRGDYAGSDSCAGCHAEIHAAWRGSPMHLMTRVPAGAGIHAPFGGGGGGAPSTFRFKDDVARLVERDGARFVDLTSAQYGDHRYRVTRVIGGRYREDFAGIEEGGADPRELLLPVSYVFETRSFRLKGYSVLVSERPGLRAGGVWSETCVFCHNTVPYFDALWGELAGPGAPSYQGTVVDRLLPPERRWRFEVDPGGGGESALRDAVAAEVTEVGGTPPRAGDDRRAALGHGIRELRSRFGARNFVEIGVGCEACHGGSREHVANPRVHPDFAPRSAFLHARPEAGGEMTRAEQVNRVCARCHQVLFSRYPFTWEGETRRGAKPGGSSITSGEARDFLLGGCARQMSCATCHDPHAEDRREDLDRLATSAGNTVCVRCHPQFAPAPALAAHAHHDPAGAGASCIACHMPKKNMGLGYALTRYHRIGLPDDPARVERDRPLECALCHVDKTVAELVGKMEVWWGRKYDRAALANLYGTLEARPLPATLMRGRAHEQAVAIAVLGDARRTETLPAVARQLANPFPLVRYYARRAVDALAPRPCPVDLERATPEIIAAVRACVPAAFPDPMPAETPAKQRAHGNDSDED